MRGLYAIVDADFLSGAGVPLVPFAKLVFGARPAVVQLRAKSASSRDVLGWLRELRELAAAASVPLFANDRPDLAVLSGCDGVHVGQEDLGVADVRRFAPSLRVGVSTHGEEQLRAALSERPAYVAFGPVFDTMSKARPDPVVGLAGLERAAPIAAAHGVPLVAIGGIDPTIDPSRAAEVGARAPLGAVIRGLLPPEGLAGVTARVCALHRALGGT